MTCSTTSHETNAPNLGLIGRICAGDRDAEAELLDANRGLIRRLGRAFLPFAHGALGRGDLEQEGALALLACARKFDPSRGVQFSSYAHVAIERAIRHAIEEA